MESAIFVTYLLDYETLLKTFNLRTLAFILWALSLVMTFSTAAGMKISHCSYMRLSPSYFLAPGNPFMEPVLMRKSSKA